MKKTFKALFNAVILSVFFLAIPLGDAEAATSSLSYFYKDSSKTKCEWDCFSFLYVTSNGTVYQVNHSNNKVNALDSAGKKKWSYTLPKSTYMARGSSTYTTDSKGNFYFSYGLDGKYYVASVSSKGKLNWKYAITTQGGPSKPLIAKDGSVYFGTGNPTDAVGPYGESYFYAVSSKGKLKFKVKLAGDSIFSPISIAKNGNIVVDRVSNFDEEIRQYTISTKGKIVSNKKLSSSSSHVVKDKKGNQYITNFNDGTLTVKDSKGKKLWSYKGKHQYLDINYISPDGYVYLSEDGYLLALSGGKVKWKVKGNAYRIFPSAKGLYTLMADYNVDYENTTVKLLDAKTGKVKGTKTYNFAIFGDTSVMHPKGFLLFSKDFHVNKISF